MCIGGIGVARGYLKRPEFTAERFVPDPFADDERALLYRTGDLARWLPDGNVDFIGRTDRQVKIRGFRIEPGEVEAALERDTGVETAAVVVREDRPGRPTRRLCRGVAWRNGFTSTLRSTLDREPPRLHGPVGDRRSSMPCPLTPNGKVDRASLPEPPVHDAEAVEGFVAPRTENERILAEIWCEVLSVDAVGVHEDFFALGGHSLLATRVLARMREAFDIEVGLRAIFEFSTVAGLARVVDEAKPAEDTLALPALRAVGRAGDRLRRLPSRDPAAETPSAPRSTQ